MSEKDFNETDSIIDSACSGECESAYRKCIDSKEDESVCRMQRAQCRCSCS
jgi:hypothetical protein